MYHFRDFGQEVFTWSFAPCRYVRPVRSARSVIDTTRSNLCAIAGAGAARSNRSATG